MEYKRRTYKGQTIVRVPADYEFGSDKFQVYFKDGARSKLIYTPEQLIDDVAANGYCENFAQMLMWDKSSLQAMTTENVSSLIGKRLYFFSEQYKANYDCEGIVTITSVDMTKRNPITCEIESGDELGLNYAFEGLDGYICIGDSDRVVKFQVL